MNSWVNPALLMGMLTLSGAISGCGDDEGPTGPPTTKASVRVVHASPDAPAVDVYAEGNPTPMFTNLSYGQASEYLDIDAGSYNIQIRENGADVGSDPVFETGDLQFANGVVVTALATGLLASQDASDRFRVLPLIEEFGDPASRNSRVRVVHASPDAPTVDIDLGDDGSSEITGLVRFGDTGAGGINVPAGTVISIGILAGGQRVTGFTAPALTSGVEYFLIASGLVGQSDIQATDAFKLLAVDQNASAAFVTQNVPVAGSAMVRAVHASPDAPAVDIYLEGKIFPSASNVRYGAATAYLTIPAGSRNIQLRAYPSAVTDPIVYETGPVDVIADQKITAVAAGFLGSTDPSERLRILPLVENFGPSQSALVRIVHASPDAPTVDLDVGDDGSAEVTSLARFADTGQAGIALPAGQALQVGVLVAGGPRVTAFTTPALPDGEEIFVIATGSLTQPAEDEGGFVLLPVTSTGSLPFLKQNPVFYALHGGPDAPAIDIYDRTNASIPVVENLGFGELSAPVQVPPGSYAFDLHATGQGTPIYGFDVDLRGGGTYLAIAAGEMDSNDPGGAFRVLPFQHSGVAAIESPLIRAIHASGDAPLVDIGTVDIGTGDMDSIIFPNMAFSESSEPFQGTEVPVGNLSIGVAPQGEDTPVATFNVTISPGQQVFAIAAGALVPDPGVEAFRLLIVVASEQPWSATEVMPD